MFAALSLALLLGASSLSPATLQTEIQGYNRHAVEPLPTLTADQRRQLLAGKVLALFLPPDPQGVVGTLGLLISSLDRDLLWLALRDPHLASTDQVQEQQLRQLGGAKAEVWHQVLCLPWPFSARHWLIEVRQNPVLAQASDNRSWERSWALVPGGELLTAHALRDGTSTALTPGQRAGAIYTVVNHGAWSMLRLPDGRTLLAFQVTTVVGGVIPDELVAHYSLGRMDEILHALEAKALDLRAHFGPGHAALSGGDGKPLRPPRNKD